MLQHKIPREMHHSEQRIQQSLEILDTVAASNLQITNAITEIIRNASGAPPLAQPVPQEPTLNISRSLTDHYKTQSAKAESPTSTAKVSPPTPVPSSQVTTATCFESPFPQSKQPPPPFTSPAENLFSPTSPIKKTPPPPATQYNNAAPSRRLSYNQPSSTLPGPDEENSESPTWRSPPTSQRPDKVNTESPNSQRPDESNSEPLSCSSADLPDLQSGSSSDDGAVQNEKDDNPFTILRVIPSPEKTTTFQFRSKCQMKKRRTGNLRRLRASS